MLRRAKEEFLPKSLRGKRRGRGATHTESRLDDVLVDPRDILETHVELKLGEFLEPFNLSKLPEVVHKLTGAGFTSCDSLRALDPHQCGELGLTDDDTERILLASWLDVYGLHQYGGRLIASGITSPLHLVETTDAALVRAGIRAIGHRRQIFRYLREDEALHERLEKAREEAEKADLERRQLMQRSSGRSLSSPSKKAASSGGRSSAQGAADIMGAGGLSDVAPLGGSAAQQNTLLRFEVLKPDGSRVEEHTDHDIATGSDLSSSTWADSLWALPWRTTGNAALLGSAPGALTEAHCEAQTPRDGFCLVGLDGKEMRVW